MKKRYLLLAGVVALMAVGCNKEHQCKCTLVDGYEDNTTENIFYLEGSISCEDITEMSYEEHVAAEGVNSLERVRVRKVKCRDYHE